MPKTFLTIISLLRLDIPLPYLLVFFPATFGLLLAYEQLSDLYYLALLMAGSVLTRSSGCIINDLFDSDFDRHVERTKNRPLASGSLSRSTALLVLAGLLACALAILVSLTVTSIIIGVLALLMMILYPLMKRFTYFPQLFLGLTFNLGCLLSYAIIKDDLNLIVVIMYLACGFWTFGYDTIYGFMDLDDDKKVGIKSSAIFFEKRPYKFYLGLSYLAFVLLAVIANYLASNYYGILGVLITVPILCWQIIKLDVTRRVNYRALFDSNVYVGLIIFIFMLGGCLME